MPSDSTVDSQGLLTKMLGPAYKSNDFSRCIKVQVIVVVAQILRALTLEFGINPTRTNVPANCTLCTTVSILLYI
jgi:hypothetical protein